MDDVTCFTMKWNSKLFGYWEEILSSLAVGNLYWTPLEALFAGHLSNIVEGRNWFMKGKKGQRVSKKRLNWTLFFVLTRTEKNHPSELELDWLLSGRLTFLSSVVLSYIALEMVSISLCQFLCSLFSKKGQVEEVDIHLVSRPRKNQALLVLSPWSCNEKNMAKTTYDFVSHCTFHYPRMILIT